MDLIVGIIVAILIVIYTLGLIALHRWWLSQWYTLYTINKRSELFGSFFISIFLAAATVAFWYVIDAIILIAAVILIRKRPSQKASIITIMVVMLAVISFSGIALQTMAGSRDSDVASESFTEDSKDDQLYDGQNSDDIGETGYAEDDAQEYYDESSDFGDEDWADEEDEFDDEDLSDEGDELDDEDLSDEDDELEEDLVNDDDIFPLSSSTYLEISDVDGLTKEECRIARNEIYARHGRLFRDKSLQRYFNSKDWYDGYIEPDDFDESVLNKYEISNRDLIVEYETEMGYR